MPNAIKIVNLLHNVKLSQRVQRYHYKLRMTQKSKVYLYEI